MEKYMYVYKSMHFHKLNRSRCIVPRLRSRSAEPLSGSLPITVAQLTHTNGNHDPDF